MLEQRPRRRPNRRHPVRHECGRQRSKSPRRKRTAIDNGDRHEPGAECDSPSQDDSNQAPVALRIPPLARTVDNDRRSNEPMVDLQSNKGTPTALRRRLLRRSPFDRRRRHRLVRTLGSFLCRISRTSLRENDNHARSRCASIRRRKSRRTVDDFRRAVDERLARSNSRPFRFHQVRRRGTLQSTNAPRGR